MCYSIPGKILEIKENIVTVDYFGEKRKARNEFLKLSVGDYIYAQAGFVIERISSKEAQQILESWKEMFFKLQEIDLRLAQKPKNLYEKANNIRQQRLGNACCVHGIIEFSNYCRNDCLYCGLRKDNLSLARYRMNVSEIIETAKSSISNLGFKALVLQSGEDLWYDDEKLLKIVKGIRENSAVFLSLSIGERDLGTYKKLYDAGARGVLLRFETSSESLYKKMRPDHVLEKRIELIKNLREMGFLIMTGFLIGLPGQSEDDILRDVELASSLGTDMFSFGPFIPHPATPLAKTDLPTMEQALNTIARTRIMNPESKILVTTSLETLDKQNGARLGLMSGGNSLMINLTPEKYRKLYEIYPGRAGVDIGAKEKVLQVVDLLQEIGRAPTDLGI